MQGGLVARKVSVRLSVCQSVCLSNVWIVTKRNKNLDRFSITYEKSFSLVFLEEEIVGGATPFT